MPCSNLQLTKTPRIPIGDFPPGVPIGLKQVRVGTDKEPVTSIGRLPAYYESVEYLHINPEVQGEKATAELVRMRFVIDLQPRLINSFA